MIRLCTDNGVMVAFAGLLRLTTGAVGTTGSGVYANPVDVDISPRWAIGATKPVFIPRKTRLANKLS